MLKTVSETSARPQYASRPQIAPRSTSRRPGSRRTSLYVLFALIALLSFGGAGCQSNPFAAQPPVADNVDQAFKDGAAKEAEAQKAEDAHRKDDADKLWTTAATYYGAVSKKFSGDNRVKAMQMQAVVQQKQAEEANPESPSYAPAQATLRNALKEDTVDPALHKQVQADYDNLVGRMDTENSKNILYKVMDGLVNLLGGNTQSSPILAIMVIAVTVTLVTWPLRVKQAQSAKELARYAPELKKIQDKYKGQPQELMQRQQAFYKKHGINQFAGCVPALLQWPIVLLMYQIILHYQFHFRHTTFLWINPATAEATAHMFPFTFIGHNLGEQDLILLALYAVSMFVQSKLTPITSSDPQVVEQQKMMSTVMPVMFFVMMIQWQLPSAFVLYWFSSNVLFVAQQAYINKHLPVLPPLVIEGDDDDAGDAGAAGKPMAPNPKLVSPKNKTQRRNK